MQSSSVSRIKQTTQRGFCASLLIAALLMCASSLAQASPLNLVLNPAPDISSAFITVDYDSTLDILTASGFAQQLETGGIGSPFLITGGSFDLAASVDDLGILTGGSLAIGGTVAGLGFNSGTLLTGSLSAIGFVDAGGDPLEFLFNVTGGDAASLYGGLGGIILGSTGFTGDWTSDFDGGAFNSVADVGVGVVPVPAALWLFGSGLIALLGLSGRNRQKRNT